jgi:hypothetical protein
MIPEIGTDGKQLSYGRACKRYWPASKDMPKVEGNPMDNDGVAGEGFLFHFCDGKTFKPLPVETIGDNPNYKKIEGEIVTSSISGAQGLPTRPVGSHEFRMKGRCERCEALDMKWNGECYVDKQGLWPIMQSDLLNLSDEKFDELLQPVHEMNCRIAFDKLDPIERGKVNEIIDEYCCSIEEGMSIVLARNEWANKAAKNGTSVVQEIANVISEASNKNNMIKTNPAVPGSFYNDQPVEQLQKQPIQSFGEMMEEHSATLIDEPTENKFAPAVAMIDVPAPFGIIDDEPEQPTTLKPFGL